MGHVCRHTAYGFTHPTIHSFIVRLLSRFVGLRSVFFVQLDAIIAFKSFFTVVGGNQFGFQP